MNRWHSETVAQLLQELDARPGGLSPHQAEERLRRYGPNELEPPRQEGLLGRILGQLKDPMILVLLGAAGVLLTALYLLFGVGVLRLFGARGEVLELARAHRCTLAVLKERSPSCGRGQIYDGSFTGRLTEGSGVTARLLEEHGVQVYGESEAGTLAERGEAREEGQRASRPLPSKYPGKND